MEKLLHRMSVLLLTLFVFGVADIVLYLVFDARGDMLRALPGRQYEVVGKLPESVQNINILPRSDDTMQESQRIALLNDKVLAQQADVPGFSLRFLELKGRIWRAELTIGPDVPLGPHKLQVFPRETLRSDAPPVEPSVVNVTVYADAAAMRRSHLSVCERYLGFGPWWLVTGVAILAGFVLWRQFTLSGETDAALQASGLGPIYKLARNKDHWELLFGLGRRHGVREGDVLALLDQKRTRVGSVTALRVGEESSQARLGLDAMVSPFYLVAKLPPQPSVTPAGASPTPPEAA